MDFSLISYFLPFHDNALLAGLTELITILAEDTIIIIVGAFLYWCVDAGAGQRMACTAVGGVFWTMGIKNYLKIPRPWDLGLIEKDQVIRAETATSYSFPSGHTTAGTNIYGYFARCAKKMWVKVLLWALVGLIGLSRIFLGCHTSYDVLAAIVISVCRIYLSTYLYDKLLPKSDWFVFIYAIPMLFAASSLLTGFDDDVVKMTCFGTSVVIGIFLERRFIHYVPKGDIFTRALQFGIGLIVLALLKLWPSFVGLGDVFWLKCIGYAVIAFWVSCIYPIILNKYNQKYAK